MCSWSNSRNLWTAVSVEHDCSIEWLYSRGHHWQLFAMRWSLMKYWWSMTAQYWVEVVTLGLPLSLSPDTVAGCSPTRQRSVEIKVREEKPTTYEYKLRANVERRGRWFRHSFLNKVISIDMQCHPTLLQRNIYTLTIRTCTCAKTICMTYGENIAGAL